MPSTGQARRHSRRAALKAAEACQQPLPALGADPADALEASKWCVSCRGVRGVPGSRSDALRRVSAESSAAPDVHGGNCSGFCTARNDQLLESRLALLAFRDANKWHIR